MSCCCTAARSHGSRRPRKRHRYLTVTIQFRSVKSDAAAGCMRAFRGVHRQHTHTHTSGTRAVMEDFTFLKKKKKSQKSLGSRQKGQHSRRVQEQCVNAVHLHAQLHGAMLKIRSFSRFRCNGENQRTDEDMSSSSSTLGGDRYIFSGIIRPNFWLTYAIRYKTTGFRQQSSISNNSKMDNLTS